MHLSPNTDDWRLAREVHRRFSSHPGADHIANTGALAHLAALLRTERVYSVLEFGAGIGTITHLLLVAPPHERHVVCIERDRFCTEQIKSNITRDLWRRATLIQDRHSEPDGPFDLIVIDGNARLSPDLLHPGLLVFIEGTRRHQRAVVAEMASKAGLESSFCPHVGRMRLSWRQTRLGIKRPVLKTGRDFGATARLAIPHLQDG